MGGGVPEWWVGGWVWSVAPALWGGGGVGGGVWPYWEAAAAAVALPTPFNLTAGVMQSSTPAAHTHTRPSPQKTGPTWNYLQRRDEQRRRESEIRGEMQAFQITLTTVPQKNLKFTPRNDRNLVSFSRSSQKFLTIAQIENILDKRFQSPFIRGTSH